MIILRSLAGILGLVLGVVLLVVGIVLAPVLILLAPVPLLVVAWWKLRKVRRGVDRKVDKAGRTVRKQHRRARRFGTRVAGELPPRRRKRRLFR